MAASYIRLKVAALLKNRNEEPPQRQDRGSFNVRNRLIRAVVLAGVSFTLSSIIFAQTAQPSVAPQAQTAKSQPFDPHDMTGIWVRGKVPRGNAPLSGNRPPMTPWGQAKFNAVKGSFTYSRAPGIAPPIAPEKEWNDPMLQCEPAGYPRVMLQIFAPLMRFI